VRKREKCMMMYSQLMFLIVRQFDLLAGFYTTNNKIAYALHNIRFFLFTYVGLNPTIYLISSNDYTFGSQFKFGKYNLLIEIWSKLLKFWITYSAVSADFFAIFCFSLDQLYTFCIYIMFKRERNKDNNVLIVEISFALHAYTAWKYFKRIPYKNKNVYNTIHIVIKFFK